MGARVTILSKAPGLTCQPVELLNIVSSRVRLGYSLGGVTVLADPPLRSILSALSANLVPPFQDPDWLCKLRLPSLRTPSAAVLYKVIPASAAKFIVVTAPMLVAAPLFMLILPPAYMLMSLSACRLMVPSVRTFTRAEWRTICALGVVFAAMNVTFYAAVERLPLGAAVTVELLGPLGLAAGLSRRLRDLGCVALALAGVVLLGWGGEHLDTFGLVLAIAAAGGWASYIMLSRSAGKASDGMGSLGLAMALAAVLVAPFGLAPGSALLRPNVMALGTVVAVQIGRAHV